MAALKLCFLCFLCLLCFLCNVEAQDRAPHGLEYENPMIFSPSAFDFFHPNAQSPNSDTPCMGSDCAPLPLSSSSSSTGVAKSSLAHESKPSSTESSKGGIGAGGIAGIVFGFVFVVIGAMGVYYVAVTRRANAGRANSVLPDV